MTWLPHVSEFFDAQSSIIGNTSRGANFILSLAARLLPGVSAPDMRVVRVRHGERWSNGLE